VSDDKLIFIHTLNPAFVV